jgi:aspartyl-tRNA(Asn)/glutamyl-tRNA(Gln) amidotransferase subunit B
VTAVELARVIAVKGELPRDVYTTAISESGDPGFSADRFLMERTTSDESALEPAIDAVLAANPDQAATYRGGKEGVLGFLVGQVLKETQGKADPKVVNRLLREKLRA